MLHVDRFSYDLLVLEDHALHYYLLLYSRLFLHLMEKRVETARFSESVRTGEKRSDDNILWNRSESTGQQQYNARPTQKFRAIHIVSIF